jgi:hypothetical protein
MKWTQGTYVQKSEASNGYSWETLVFGSSFFLQVLKGFCSGSLNWCKDKHNQKLVCWLLGNLYLEVIEKFVNSLFLIWGFPEYYLFRLDYWFGSKSGYLWSLDTEQVNITYWRLSVTTTRRVNLGGKDILETAGFKSYITVNLYFKSYMVLVKTI